jgi:hypothetical protein
MKLGVAGSMWDEEEKLSPITRPIPSSPISSTPVRFDAPKRKRTYIIVPYRPVGEQV